MTDPRAPLLMNILVGIFIFMFNWIDPVFALIGLGIVFFSICIIIYNTIPSVRFQRKRIEKAARTMPFGQLYVETLRRYIPRLLKWWMIFILIFGMMVPVTLVLASAFDRGHADEGTIAAIPIENIPNYKDDDKDGYSDYRPYVPLTGFWSSIWAFRGSIPRFKYEYPAGVAVIVGFDKPRNVLFFPIEFYTAGLFYLDAYISDPLAYAPITPQLMFYWMVTLLVGTIPLFIIAAVVVLIFVAIIYGATPVLVGQAVKLPFRILDGIMFLIRFLFIGWTAIGLGMGFITTLIKLPITIGSIISLLLKIPLNLLILMKTGFGFLIFVATATWTVIWFITRNGFALIYYGLYKIINAGYMILLYLADILTGPFRWGGRLFSGQSTLQPVRRQSRKIRRKKKKKRRKYR